VAELDQTGARSKVVAAHEVFVALNSRFFVAITDRRSGRVEGISWQQMITPTCHGMPESCRVRREDAVYDVMEPTRARGHVVARPELQRKKLGLRGRSVSSRTNGPHMARAVLPRRVRMTAAQKCPSDQSLCLERVTRIELA
jgi:hypothetical protein